MPIIKSSKIWSNSEQLLKDFLLQNVYNRKSFHNCSLFDQFSVVFGFARNWKLKNVIKQWKNIEGSLTIKFEKSWAHAGSKQQKYIHRPKQKIHLSTETKHTFLDRNKNKYIHQPTQKMYSLTEAKNTFINRNKQCIHRPKQKIH